MGIDIGIEIDISGTGLGIRNSLFRLTFMFLIRNGKEFVKLCNVFFYVRCPHRLILFVMRGYPLSLK
jgi:hypothetical protein